MQIYLVVILLLSLNIQASFCFEKIVDWSSVSVLQGQKWYNIEGKEAALEEIFFENGFTIARQRLFTGPGIYDFDSNVKLAKRALASGMKVYIDIHLRNDYNDPQQIQCDPRWGSTVKDISEGIYNYCFSVGNKLSEHDIIPRYIAIGNEVSNGVCEIGNITASSDGLKNTATFLSLASKGLRDSSLGNRTQLMIHLENGWNTTLFETWFGDVEEAGLPRTAFDVVGMTSYPFYHAINATQENFYNSIKIVQEKYKKQVFVVETAWPRVVPEVLKTHALPPDANFPISVQGQCDWIRLMADTIAKARAGGMGYFEPAWINNPTTGSNFPNVLLFDEIGRALPSLAAFKTV